MLRRAVHDQNCFSTRLEPHHVPGPAYHSGCDVGAQIPRTHTLVMRLLTAIGVPEDLQRPEIPLQLGASPALAEPVTHE